MTAQMSQAQAEVQGRQAVAAFAITPQAHARPAWFPTTAFVRYWSWHFPSRKKDGVSATNRFHVFGSCPELRQRPRTASTVEVVERSVKACESRGLVLCKTCAWGVDLAQAVQSDTLHRKVLG